jgi:tetratricopeptide (TPR) repeat protein
MAFVAMAAHRPADLTRVLARATELAGDNVERKLVVARTAIQYGHHAYARTLVEPMLQTSPTRDLYQLAAQMALARSEHAIALRYFEQAQDAGADEAAELHAVRSELRQIIQLAQQIAVQSAGSERAGAIERALHWGQRWRSVDPGNAEIDTLLGELLLAVGDGPGAFRQLSSTIERDPWSGTGYATVASALEREGHIEEALAVWQQAIVIDQTNPTHRLRKAQSLIAVGRIAEGDALLEQVANGTWHAMWSSTVYQARNLLERGKQRTP